MSAAKERQRDVLALPWFWLSVFVLAPFLIVLAISISSATYGAPPLELFVDWKNGHPLFDINFDNYALLASDNLYLRGFLYSYNNTNKTTKNNQHNKHHHHKKKTTKLVQ